MSDNAWPVEIPDLDYTGKNVVVTGSTKGIGKAIAFAYARCGANVVISGRSEDDCGRVAGEINKLGGKAVGIRADVKSVSDITLLEKKAQESFGPPDIWVNCAGTALTEKILDVNEEDYDLVMETNLKSVYFASQAAARSMKENRGGVIIQIASIGGLKGTNGLSLYGASKAAVINLTKTMALEWSRFGIRVNAICPGYVETEMNRETFAEETFRERVVGENPQHRLGTTDEVAAVALFLGSDLSGMINGEAVVADMGTLCG